MHGQYIGSKDTGLISEEGAFLWLSRGDTKADNESEITAARDQTLQNNHHAIKILILMHLLTAIGLTSGGGKTEQQM
jgi:hypothetical protein